MSLVQSIKAADYACTGRDMVQASAKFLNERSISHNIINRLNEDGCENSRKIVTGHFLSIFLDLKGLV